MTVKYVFNPTTGKIDATDKVAFNGEVVAGSAASPSIFFTGDPNTGIYSPGADQVALSTNGTGRLFVDASGRIGVGTSAPASSNGNVGNVLQVASTGNTSSAVVASTPGTGLDNAGIFEAKATAQSSGSDRIGQIYIGRENTSTTALSGYMGLSTSNNGSFGERLRITSAGRVGIGTSSPGCPLNIAANNTPFRGQLSLQTTSGSDFSQLTFYDQSTLGAQLYQQYTGTAGTGDFVIQTAGVNSPLIFGTAGSERLRITSAGLVGVGTSSPGTRVDIASNFAYGTASSNVVRLGASFSGGTTTSPSSIGAITWGSNDTASEHGRINVAMLNPSISNNSRMEFWINSSGMSQAMTLTPTGLGIGTTSPLSIFDVKPTSNKHVVVSASASYASNAIVAIDDGGGETALGIGGNPIQFFTGATERLRIDSSGRLLVGTSSGRNIGTIYQHRLQIETTQYAGLSIVNNTADTGPALLVLAKSRGTSVGSANLVQANDVLGSLTFAGADGTDIETPGASIDAFVDGTPGANDMPGRLVFSTTEDGASSPTERMRIQSDGNILIGITSGATGLLSVGPVANKTGIFASASTAGSPGIQGAHTVNSATGYVAYFANSGSATGLYISNTAAWQSTSDVRLKTDIQDLDAVSRLMQIKPKSYLWKSQATSDEPTKRNFGFIAQEVQEVFPELVGESPDGMLSVEYTGLIAPLVNTIQFLKAEIDALKAEVAALKAQ